MASGLLRRVFLETTPVFVMGKELTCEHGADHALHVGVHAKAGRDAKMAPTCR